MFITITFILWWCFVKFGCCNHTIEWNGGYISSDFPGYIAEYVYFTEKVTWNEARDVCLSIGGDLAKIDSMLVKDLLVHVADAAYPPDFFGNDKYWIGLFETSAGNHTWALDCSPLTYDSNFVDPWNQNKQCFRVKPNDGHIGEREKCDHNEQFLCEKRSANVCRVKEYAHFKTFKRREGNYTYTSCKAQCDEQPFCLGVVHLPPEVCAMYYGSDYGVPSSATVIPETITIGKKFCMQFRWNSTDVDPPENDAKTPITDCGITHAHDISSTISPTLSNTFILSSTSDIPTVPCDCMMHSVAGESVTCFPSMGHAQCVCPVITKIISSTITHNIINITIIEAEKIAEEISKNLTVDSKQTSAHHRKLTSAKDRRRTSVVMGTIGVVCLTLPFGLIVLCDIKRIVDDLGLLRCCDSSL